MAPHLMAPCKYIIAAISLAALLATANPASASEVSTVPGVFAAPLVVATETASAFPQDAGGFFHRLQQMRSRRAKYDQHLVPNPEPATLSLLGLGGLGLAYSRRRKAKRARTN